MSGVFAVRTLAKKHDVGDDGGSLAFERVGGQADRSDEVGLGGEIFADRGILLVEREMRRDQASTPPGFSESTDLAKKKSCSESFCP